MTRWKPDAAGRLSKAAFELFVEQGYEATTVAEIAERAGLTKRTFFRHFADKREVLFAGAGEMEGYWLAEIAAAAPDAEPLEAVCGGFDSISDMFAERHAFARVRSSIVEGNPEVKERELIKMHRLTAAIEDALVQRGTPAHAAKLAAQVGVTVFHVAFGRWLQQEDPAALRPMLDETLNELRSVLAAHS